jgi:hypothetical protein
MAVATGVSMAYAAAQAAVAAGNLAVQASTIVGIATAGVAAAAIAVLTAKVYGAVNANQKHAASIAKVTEETGLMKNMIDKARAAADAKRAADEAATTAAQNAADAAERAKRAEADRYKTFKDNLKGAKDAIRAYVAEVATAINSQVNLSAAFSQATDEQTDATDKLNEALQERREAYATLQQAQATGDTKAYADALQNVALAESKVNDAQAVKPKNYTQIFAEQIAAAKAFAGYVKQLAAAGLSRAGIGQILDLGPVAGSQVAKDLLAGTSGMSISSLNRDLADIATTGTAAGMATPGFAETLGATAGRSGPGAYYITIEAGVSSPTDIAKTVEGVLQTYGSTSGGIKVKTKRPKTAAGKRK